MSRVRVSCLLVGLLASAAPASAQMGPEDSGEDYWIDGANQARGTRQQGPLSLEEARGTGRGVRLGSGRVVDRVVPSVYTVRRGDTLWDITGRFYGNPWSWPRVWSYNPEVTNPHWIYPNDQMRLLPEGQAQATLPESGQRVRAGGRPEQGSVWLRDQGYLDADAVRGSGIIVGSPEEHMLLSPYDEVYIRFDDDTGVRPGMQLSVFREVESDEREPEEQGVLVRIFGSVRLRSYDQERHMGRAIIDEAIDPIERGYRVANMPRRFEMVPPVPNDRDLAGTVVASLLPRQLHGDFQVVFVNLGAEEGVRPGNRFFVVRRGDEWRASLTASEESVGATLPDSERTADFPPEIIAEARVVNVRPHSAGLMVTRSTTDITFGDRVEMRRGY